MRLVLLTLACAATLGAWPRAQAPDLSEILRGLRAQEHKPESATAEDIWRRLSAPIRFRNFSEFHGTWMLDEQATGGIQYVTRQRPGRIPVDAIGRDIARRIVIAGTDTEIVLTKDDGAAEPYAFDGAERQAAGLPTAATRYSFALVAGALALTSRTTDCCDGDGQPRIDILTDAYSLPQFDVLEVRRQSSVLRAGAPMTLSAVRRLSTPLTYRRVP